MERALTVDEKIRRAEEIYQRRQAVSERKSYATVNVSKEKANYGNRTIKRMILQIVICFIIYAIYYLIQNGNYIFSENILNKTKDVLSYNINFNQYYEQFMKLFNKEENGEQNNNDTENISNDVNNIEEGIGGSTEELIIEGGSVPSTEAHAENVVENTVNTSNLSQMEIDAIDIKNSISFISPLLGTITSRFGMRNPTTKTVPQNHTGIDIAANTGTTIISATDGIVSLVSSEGDYGKHIKIVNGDVTILYAHCKTIYVKENQEVKQGEAIAEVGSTGNTTGPHLHFEIRKQDRFVNPELVLGPM